MSRFFARLIARTIAVGLCALIGAAHAQQGQGAVGSAGEPQRRWFTVTIDPKSIVSHGAYVGGEIVMDVRFVSSDPFTRLRLELPDIEDARTQTLIRPHTLQINMFGGKGYSHQTRLAIVPLRTGALTIAAITVTGVALSRDGRHFEFKEIHPPRRLTVHGPPADFPATTWVVSRQVDIEEAWTPDIATVHPGDTVQRKIVLTVMGVKAEELPELRLASNTGYRVLNTETAISTEKTESGLTAHLEQTWNIFIDTDAVTYIDAVPFVYWDPEQGRAEQVTAPRQRVEPMLRGAAKHRQRLREQAYTEHKAKRLGLIAVLAAPLTGLLALAGIALWHALPGRADWRLWRAAGRARSPLDFYASFLEWGGRTFGPRVPVDQGRIASLGPRAAGQVTKMHETLFGNSARTFNAKRTAVRLIWAARRRRLHDWWRTVGPGVARALYLR
ncbi:MAG: hypothetical protein GKR94_17665 [Gammaproteobacteria bacterium]|nr:hypothetical protein [Gammaproteobacteria bacterium]